MYRCPDTQRINQLLKLCSWWLPAVVALAGVGCAHSARNPIEGTVYDSREHAVPGVVVTVSREGGDSKNGECVKVTDSDGFFSCRSLDGTTFKPTRQYRVVFVKADFDRHEAVLIYRRDIGTLNTILTEPGVGGGKTEIEQTGKTPIHSHSGGEVAQ